MASPTRALGLLLLFSLAASCSSGDDGAEPAAITTAQACADWASAVCAQTSTCAPARLGDSFRDLSTCLHWETEICTRITSAEGAQGTASQWKSCAGAIQDATCDEWLHAGTEELDEACAIAGALEDGSACRYGEQCASAFCRTPDGLDCGVCASKRPLGTACTDSYECEGDLICQAVCIEPAGAGADCDDVMLCDEAFVCVGADAGTPGICRKPLAEGEGCDPQADACDWQVRLFCHPELGTCQSVDLAPVGAACGRQPDGSYVRCEGFSAFCGDTDTCVPTLADGASCDPAGTPCTSPAECIDGACAVFDAGSCK